MAKICNQLFVKDTHRDKKYICTVKCVYCGGESNLNLKLPILLIDYNKFLTKFIKTHKDKGCNKFKLNSPEWASKEINIAISV